MNDRFVYLDSSAFAKLVVPEPESAALRRYLRRRPLHAASAVLRTDVLRAASRGTQTHVAKARSLLRKVALIEVDRDVLDRAGTLPPPEMRSLDAIHLAAALSLDDDLAEVVTYDVRMAAAAQSQGISVASSA